MKKILFIDFFPQGGSAAGLITELELLLSEKKYIPLVAAGKDSILETFLVEKNLQHILVEVEKGTELYKNKYAFIKAYLRLLFFSLKNRVNLIHVNHYEWSAMGVLLSLVLRTPLIIHLKDVYLIPHGIRRFLFSFYSNTTYIAVSKYVKSLYLTEYGLSTKKVVTIYDGIHEDFIKKTSKTKSKSKKITVGMIGRLAQDRGVKEFIEMCYLVSKRVKNASFVHVGHAYSEKTNTLLHYKKLSSIYGLEKKLKFLPYSKNRAELVNTYKNFDVFVLTASRFAFPNVLAEAMLVGLPSVAFDVGGITEMINESKSGILIPEQSVPLLADSVENLLKSPHQREKLGINASRYASKKYLSKITYPKISKLYASLLG